VFQHRHSAMSMWLPVIIGAVYQISVNFSSFIVLNVLLNVLKLQA